MHQLKITIIHALGTFVGYATFQKPEEATYDNIRDTADGLQLQINNLSRLVLTSSTGIEMAFGEKILGESIILFNIEEVDK